MTCNLVAFYAYHLLCCKGLYDYFLKDEICLCHSKTRNVTVKLEITQFG